MHSSILAKLLELNKKLVPFRYVISSGDQTFLNANAVIPDKPAMSDKEFWFMVKDAEWGMDVDIDAIGKRLRKKYRKKKMELMQLRYEEKLSELAEILEDHAEKKCGNRHGYYRVSDDSFWDLRAHIIGLGEDYYNGVVAYPEIAKVMADEHQYMENFGYIFQIALPENYNQGGSMNPVDAPSEPKLSKPIGRSFYKALMTEIALGS